MSKLLEIPQQLLAGEGCDSELQFKLDRACSAHCVFAAMVIMKDATISPDDLVAFVDKNGATSGSDFYSEGHGWRMPGLAELLRQENLNAVCQNLNISGYEYQPDAARSSGRVKTAEELAILGELTAYGGLNRNIWRSALLDTTERGGVVATSIEIPLRSGYGTGGHTVIVTGVDLGSQRVTYFDPDRYNIDRLNDRDLDIGTTDGLEGRFFDRPIKHMLRIMTGEVVHITEFE